MNALTGRRVLVTRPRTDDDPLVAALVGRGAVAVPFPTIEIRPVENLRPLDAAIQRLTDYAWIAITSANGVEVFADRLDASGLTLPTGVRVAAVGTATAKALAARGLPVDFLPSAFRGAVLGAELPEVEGRRVLLPRAAIAREDLGTILAERGAVVDDLPVYDTVPTAPDAAGLEELEGHALDAVTFTSASTVRNFAALLGARASNLLDGVTVACIGPVTADEARALGFAVHVEPAEHTIPGLVAALGAHFAGAREARRATS